MRSRLQRRARDERGVILVLVAVLIVAMLALAAFVIDVGSWYQTQRQAQAAADAAALAGAHDLPASPTTATTDAQTYVAKNIAGATATVTTPYSGSTSKIQVTVTKVAPSYFGKLLGISSATVTASAAAAKTATTTTCSSPGSSCDAVFAMDTSCTGTPLDFGGGTTINGGVDSNGSINVGGGGSSYGATVFGNGTGCKITPTGYATQSNTFTSGPTTQAPLATWPVNYASDFPSCTGSACTGPGGTPSFCTNASTAGSEYLFSYYPYTLSSGNIYCDVGSGTPATPTTWNGAISAYGGPVEASFVAGTVYFGGGDTITACGYTASGYAASGCNAGVPVPSTTNYPAAYAVGTGTAVTTSSGGGDFTGDMFAPNGTIVMGGGATATFLEAQDVSVTSGGFTGDGPLISGGGSPSGVSESLVG